MSDDVKCWGTTRCVAKTPAFQVHHLDIKAGAWCSRHKHKSKVNLFHVVSGVLEVRVYENDSSARHYTEVLSRERRDLRVMAGVWHRFRAVTDVVAIEVYYSPDVADDDITRVDAGGTGPLKEDGL